jgi:ubiquinone/menaquinone biosynthesis C-methylase UbiE
MSAFDVYGMTDKLSNSIAEVIVARLEARGKNPRFQAMMQEYLGAMQIDSARQVLDIGCGTGVASREIGTRPAFSGAVTGIDLSPYLIEVAQRLCAEEGLGQRTTFRVGDTRSLDISDESFDAVVAHTLVSHVENPLAVVKEAARAVRRGGLVGIFDGDYASLTFGHQDPSEGKKYDEAIQQAIITNPRVMRDMPRLLSAAGLHLVESFSYVLAEIGKADFWVTAIESFRKLVPQSGIMPAEEINAWADARMRDSGEGVFFGASNFYAYVARRL